MNVNSATQSASPVVNEESLLEAVLRRLNDIGSIQYNNLNEIESRLHTVLDQRQPSSRSEVEAETKQVDFSQKVFKAIEFLQWQAERTNYIREHLSRII